MAFRGCQQLAAVIIPDSVHTIGYLAFQDCILLEEVDLGRNIKTIEHGAFLGCKSLAGINIPGTVTSIGDNAFKDCWKLVTVILGEGVSSIGKGSFQSCSSLEMITIHASVTYLGQESFSNNFSLAGVYFQGNAPACGYEPFRIASPGLTVYCYEGTNGWGGIFAGRSTVTLPHPGPWLKAIIFKDNWRYLDWFGWFWLSPYGWIYQLDYGWMYASGQTDENFHLYSLDEGAWFWTSVYFFPYAYKYGPDGGWSYFYFPLTGTGK